MATLQVKGMDDDLYRALAARARIDNRSLSQEVVSMIRHFLGRPPSDPTEATRAFLALAGSWVDPRPARAVAAELRRARRSGRRFRKQARVFD